MYSVSVIIPAHNREKLLNGAVQSVLAQTHQDFEIIIVDDGSTDATRELVGGLVEQDRRIRYLQHDTNRGAPVARNTGIRAAKGDWIAFLDSDDQLLCDSLQVRLRLAREKRIHVVHSECLVLHPAAGEPERYGTPPMQGRIYKELLGRCGPTFPGLLVSKEALTRVGFLDETIMSHQEWDTSIRLAKYYEFGYVPEPTFTYDRRFADSISKNLIHQAKGYEQVFTKHFWPIFWFLGPKALVRHYIRAARFYLQAKDEGNARRCSLRAFLLWPFQPRTISRGVARLLKSGFNRIFVSANGGGKGR